MNTALIDLIDLVNDFVLKETKKNISDFDNNTFIEEVRNRLELGRIPSETILCLFQTEEIADFCQCRLNLDEVYSEREIMDYVMDYVDIEDYYEIARR